MTERERNPVSRSNPTPNLVVSLIGGCSVPLKRLAGRIEAVLADEGLNVKIRPPARYSGEWEYGYDGLTSEEFASIEQEEVAPSRSEEITIARSNLEERRWLMLLHGVNVALTRLGLGGMIEVVYDSRQLQPGPHYDPENITFTVRRRP